MPRLMLSIVFTCTIVLAACQGDSSPKNPVSAAARKSPPLVSAGPDGYLRTSRTSADIVSKDATYRLVDGYDQHAVGSLEFSNGWSIERSDKYPSVVNKWMFVSFSTPYAECQGKEETLQDFGETYLRANAICRGVKSFEVHAQGYAGGEYLFQGSAGDLFFLSQTQGGLPTFYRLRSVGN